MVERIYDDGRDHKELQDELRRRKQPNDPIRPTTHAAAPAAAAAAATEDAGYSSLHQQQRLHNQLRHKQHLNHRQQ